jgi:signal recognition particle receptor subunit beta
MVLLLINEDDSDQLNTLFKESGIHPKTTTSGEEAAKIIDKEKVSLFILCYTKIVDANRETVLALFKHAQKAKFLIFNVPGDAKRRLAFYKMGAYRIFDSDYDITDIAALSRNILDKQNMLKNSDDSRFSGSLSDFTLAELINSFGKEKRTGVLKVQTAFGAGKIYFNKGEIDDAHTGFRKGDEAVIYMLCWPSGQFSMHPSSLKTPRHRVQLSNIGILLHGETIRQQFLKKLQTIGSIQAEIRLINQGDILSKANDRNYKTFVKKLTRFTKLSDILESSPFGILDTLNHIVDLRKENYLDLKIHKDDFDLPSVYEKQESSGLVEQLLSAEEIETLKQKLGVESSTVGKLIIIGTNTCRKTDFIRQMNQGSINDMRSNQDLDYATVELTSGFTLQVFGIPLDRKLSHVIDKLSEGLLGYIILVDAQRPDELEYTNYITNNLIAPHKVAITLAITNFKDDNKKIINEIKKAISPPEGRDIPVCDVSNKDDVRKVLLSLSR